MRRGTLFVILLMLVTAFGVSDMASASHRCGTIRPTGQGTVNWFGSGRSREARVATGVGGRFEIRWPFNLEPYGEHVEAFYLIKDRANFLEYGWYINRGLVNTNPHNLFHARRYSGKYKSQSVDQGDGLIGVQYAAMYHVPSAGRFRFSRNSVEYPSSVNRDPPFIKAVPAAIVEGRDACDYAAARFWDLDYRTSAGSWLDWSNTRFTCDLLDHFGYTAESGDAFKFDSRQDSYVDSSTCNPVREVG